MSRALALRIEIAIIGLGVLALLLIFQPFHLRLFSAGCGLVVLAALANNLLPLAEPGRPLRGLLLAAAIVALIFCCVVLVAIAAAHLYGLLFLKPPPAATPAPPSDPFWLQPLVWWLAGFAALFALLVAALSRKSA